MNNIKSMEKLGLGPKYNNISFFYFSPKYKLISHYDIFYFFFFVINNDLYISDYDLEFNKIYNFFINPTKKNKLLIQQEIFSYKKFDTLEIDKGILIKNLYTNAGHSFGNITRIIYKIFNETNDNIDDFKIIVPEDLYKYNSFLISIIYLFFKNEKILILKEKTVLKCKILYNYSDYSHKRIREVNFLLNKLSNYNMNKQKYCNIFLIKSTETLNTNLRGTFDKKYKEYIENRGFIHINPENYNIIDLYNIINNAQNIIMSWGCNSYLNSIFVNKNSNFLLLCHKDYEHEYHRHIISSKICETPWFPQKCKKKIYIPYLKTIFGKNEKNLINLKIIELLE